MRSIVCSIILAALLPLVSPADWRKDMDDLCGYVVANATPAAKPPVAGYILWLDASDSATLTTTSGLVDQWNDKSGNNNHATSTGANRPLAGTYHSRAAVTAGGTNQMTLTTGIAAGTGTIFVVAYKASVANKGMVFWGSDTTAYFNLGDSASGSWQGYATAGNGAAFSPSVDWTKVRVATFRVGPTGAGSLKYYVGTTAGTAANNTLALPYGNPWTQLFYYGVAAYQLSGGILQVLVYPWPMSDTELTDTQNWLTTYTGGADI